MKIKTKLNAILISRGVIPLLTLLALAFGVQSVAAQGAGDSLYKTKCAACHGPDGKGDTTVGKMQQIRDLTSADVQKQSDADLTAILVNGKNKMPAYGKSLKPEQVKDLVEYIRTLAKK
jgi:cytochrome c6